MAICSKLFRVSSSQSGRFTFLFLSLFFVFFTWGFPGGLAVCPHQKTRGVLTHAPSQALVAFQERFQHARLGACFQHSLESMKLPVSQGTIADDADYLVFLHLFFQTVTTKQKFARSASEILWANFALSKIYFSFPKSLKSRLSIIRTAFADFIFHV